MSLHFIHYRCLSRSFHSIIVNSLCILVIRSNLFEFSSKPKIWAFDLMQLLLLLLLPMLQYCFNVNSDISLFVYCWEKILALIGFPCSLLPTDLYILLYTTYRNREQQKHTHTQSCSEKFIHSIQWNTVYSWLNCCCCARHPIRWRNSLKEIELQFPSIIAFNGNKWSESLKFIAWY